MKTKQKNKKKTRQTQQTQKIGQLKIRKKVSSKKKNDGEKIKRR